MYPWAGDNRGPFRQAQRGDTLVEGRRHGTVFEPVAEAQVQTVVPLGGFHVMTFVNEVSVWLIQGFGVRVMVAMG